MRLDKVHIIWLGAVFLASMISWIALEDIESHATWSYTDDISITYAHIYKFPERFEDDIYSVKSLGSRTGSIVNWGSALLWKHYDFDPLSTYTLFAYMQSLTLGLSIFFITWQMTKHAGISFLAIAVVYAVRPYVWNFGSYNDLYPYVYAAQLSLNFVLFGLGFILAKRKFFALICLMLAGLIHPMMAGYGFSIVGLYWGVILIQQRDWEALKPLLALVLTALVTFIPSTVASSQFQTPVSAELITKTLLDNGHLNPLPLIRILRDPQAIGFLFWFSLAIYSLIILPRQNNLSVIILTMSMIVAAFGLIISQWIGILLEIDTLLLISGGRVSYILAMWVIPLVMTLLLHYFQTHNALAIYILANSISILVFSRTPFFIIVHLFLLFLLELLSRKPISSRYKLTPRVMIYIRGIILSTFLATLVIFIGKPFIANTTENEYLRYIFSVIDEASRALEPWHFVVVAITSLFVAIDFRKTLLPSFSGKIPYSKWGISLLFMSFILGSYNSVEASKSRFQNEAVYEIKQLQDWALENTAEDAFFMGVITGWRSRTIRPYLYFVPRSWYIYTNDDRLLKWQENYLEWLGHEVEPPHPTYGIGGDQGYLKLNSQSVLGLREEEGVDYAIWSKESHLLDFKIVYETQNYIIYDLHQPTSSLISNADVEIANKDVVNPLTGSGFIFDARQDAGFNSLRPNIVLDYIPSLRVSPSANLCYLNDYRLQILENIIAQPVKMSILRIEYVYIDNLGWEQLSEESRLALTNPNIYEEIVTISHEGQIRSLYRLRNFNLNDSKTSSLTECSSMSK